MRLVIGLLVAICGLASPAKAWEFRYIKGERAGELSSCAAVDSFSGGYIIIRLYQQQLDVLLRDVSFALPQAKALGPLGFRIEDKIIIGTAVSSATAAIESTTGFTDLIQVDFSDEDSVDLLTALKGGETANILFPNGDQRKIHLSGSAAVLDEAALCWSYAQTGLIGKNPFERSQSDGDGGLSQRNFKAEPPPAKRPSAASETTGREYPV